MATYYAGMILALEYASSIWSPLASSTSINKLQVMQNVALRTATGFTQTYNTCMTHTSHAQAPATSRITIQTGRKTNPSHQLHKYTTYFNTPS